MKYLAMLRTKQDNQTMKMTKSHLT